jgi:NADH dehydrogenase FAD-containing subunit
MIERKSHFNYLFNFPRYSVLAGHEEYAFIPYDMMEKAAPKGSFRRIRDIATSIKDGRVYLESGEAIEFSYLVIATGSKQGLPSKGIATEKKDGCRELQTVQENIQIANRIAVVGGGAVGVELATDIKYFHPDKDVTIVHSRERLLQRFGPRLHDHVAVKMREMGIHMRLGERPEIVTEERALLFPNGERQEYDLIVRFLFNMGEQIANDNVSSYHAPAKPQTPQSCKTWPPESYPRAQNRSACNRRYK